MTSSDAYEDAYVWIWLPDAAEPVVAGRLFADGDRLHFLYGRSYLARDDAIAIYDPELPLRRGTLPLLNGLSMPSCLRDAAPDAWGRRVIINRKLGARGREVDTERLDELTYLLESGSDRIGALDFQRSATSYVARNASNASLEELLTAADKVEAGIPLDPDLDQALFHGSSIGGARPKALIVDGERKYIAKFSAQGDVYNIVKGEYVAMRLAAEAGLDVAPVGLRRVAGRDVLLIERFDRTSEGHTWKRRAMVSALTLLALDEMLARYASYEDLATLVRHRFDEPRDTLRELFSRMVFNILCGNTVDHARNHAAFWDGSHLALTPAYDICPQPRTGTEASQAMLILGDRRESRLALCLEAAPSFLLGNAEARRIVRRQVDVLRNGWDAVCAEANLSPIERSYFRGRQFLNPFAFEGLPSSLKLKV